MSNIKAVSYDQSIYQQSFKLTETFRDIGNNLTETFREIGNVIKQIFSKITPMPSKVYDYFFANKQVEVLDISVSESLGEDVDVIRPHADLIDTEFMRLRAIRRNSGNIPDELVIDLLDRFDQIPQEELDLYPTDVRNKLWAQEQFLREEIGWAKPLQNPKDLKLYNALIFRNWQPDQNTIKGIECRFNLYKMQFKIAHESPAVKDVQDLILRINHEIDHGNHSPEILQKLSEKREYLFTNMWGRN